MNRARVLGTAVVALVSVAGPGIARPRKVLVLPLDGTASVATRNRLSASVQRLSRVLDGTVATGTATFVDAAAAVGCDPSRPACADQVRKMLGVDELVYGTVTESSDGEVVIVVRRSRAGTPPHEVSVEVSSNEPLDRTEATILPLFRGAGAEPSAVPPGTPSAGSEPPGDEVPGPPAEPGARSRQWRIGLGGTVAGGAMLLGGFALWSSKSSLQVQINDHAVDDEKDFRELRALEDRASTRAWVGNLVVLGGLVVGGFGGYLLWQDHKARRQVTVSSQPVEGGAAITLRFLGAGW